MKSFIKVSSAFTSRMLKESSDLELDKDCKIAGDSLQQLLDESSNDYSSLSQQITELQSELHNSTAMINQLKSENSKFAQESLNLRNNGQRVQNLLDTLTKLHDRDLEQLQSRENALRENEMKWRAFMNQERCELMKMQNDLEQKGVSRQELSSQILRELEQDFESRYRSQEEELKSLEDEYYAEKREKERLLISSEVELSTLRQELNVATSIKSNEEKSLQNQINLLTEGASESGKLLQRKIIENRELKLGLDQMKVVEDELEKELDETNKGRKGIETEMMKLKSDFEVTMVNEKASLATVKAENSALQVDVDMLQAELVGCKSVIRQHKDRLMAAETQMTSVKSLLEDKQRELLNSEKQRKQEFERACLKHNAEVTLLKDEVDSLVRRNNNLEDDVRKLKIALNELEKQNIAKEETLKRTMHESMASVNCENAKLNKDIAILQNELTSKTLSFNSELEHLNYTRKMLDNDLAMETNEREAIGRKYEMLTKLLENTKDNTHKLEQELLRMSKREIQIERNLNECNEKLEDEESKTNLLQNELETSERNFNEFKNQATIQMQDLENELLNITKNCEKEKTELTEAMSTKEAMLISQISKEKKRSSAYKEKAIEAHEKHVQAKRLLALKRDFET